MDDVLDVYGEANKRAMRSIIKTSGFQDLEREDLSEAEVEKTLSRYQVIEVRGGGKRVIPADLYVDPEIKRLKNLAGRESLVKGGELTDYIYRTKEEFIMYDYKTGDYGHITEEGYFAFFPTEEEQDRIRKALQDAL